MSMSRLAVAFGVCLLCLSLHRPAHAADAGELEQVKRELAELRQSYEARLQSLEKRIVELQAQSPQAAPQAAQQATAAGSASAAGAVPNAAPVEAGAAAPVAAASPSANAATAFNPSISLILAGSYANLSPNPDTYKLQGFVPTGGEVGPGVRGFSIGESEL